MARLAVLRMITVALLFAAVAGGIWAFANSVAAADLTEADFEKLHQELQVAADKPWRSIPWKTAVLDAQQAAAEQAKPIFIWAMDGHPLGCT